MNGVAGEHRLTLLSALVLVPSSLSSAPQPLSLQRNAHCLSLSIFSFVAEGDFSPNALKTLSFIIIVVVFSSMWPHHHHHILLVLPLLLCSPLPLVGAQSREARSLDAIMQEYAYKALVRPKTSTIYNAISLLPSNFTGIKVVTLRLRSGGLRRRGVVPNYNEIPIGIIEKPYVKRLYPLPNYTEEAVVGGEDLGSGGNDVG
ncbi:hypothetical protein V8G54_002169 [Vigna mungo]|uniref:Uncharacterized protein n=1 Tax=Vigna mungo TaxID=3915 RepID=A0AAQ3P8B6_VIGMU